MQHKLLKTTLLALLVWAVVPSLKAQVAHVGDILCEGNLIYPPSTYPASGATAIGVVFYVDNTGQHGWAVALEDAGEYAWGGYGSANAPLPHYNYRRQAVYDLDGYENTRIVREHNATHPAFYAVDFESGWYVPSIGQLNYLFGNLVEVNASLREVAGNQFTNGWEYWSSTMYSDNYAWTLKSSGELNTYVTATNYSRGVRSVRNF